VSAEEAPEEHVQTRIAYVGQSPQAPSTEGPRPGTKKTN